MVMELYLSSSGRGLRTYMGFDEHPCVFGPNLTNERFLQTSDKASHLARPRHKPDWKDEAHECALFLGQALVATMYT